MFAQPVGWAIFLLLLVSFYFIYICVFERINMATPKKYISCNDSFKHIYISMYLPPATYICMEDIKMIAIKKTYIYI